MRRSDSDASKVRQVLEKHGYSSSVRGKIYSESRKNHRRVKVWICEVKTSNYMEVEQDLREAFGERFKSCYNLDTYWGLNKTISFIVELTPFKRSKFAKDPRWTV